MGSGGVGREFKKRVACKVMGAFNA